MGFSTPWWEHLKTEEATIGNLQTENIGVSASQSTDLVVSDGVEHRLEINEVSLPYFDDFGELDKANHEIVLEHPSHHEIVAHCRVSAADQLGQVELRIYVNGTERAYAEGSTTSGNDLEASASVYLKLEKGDKIWATVQHDTGGTETFPGNGGGNFVSCVRQ